MPPNAALSGSQSKAPGFAGGWLLTDEGAIQLTLWESSPGNVHMLTRSSCGCICRSDSTNYGSTWSKLKPTSLPNNNSGIDLDRAPNGALLLACNKVSKNWGPRTPLNLVTSLDNGETWQDVHELETGPGEYSYPSVVTTPEGFAGTYTWKRDSIVFCNKSNKRTSILFDAAWVGGVAVASFRHLLSVDNFVCKLQNVRVIFRRAYAQKGTPQEGC
ncbi:exo-alpha-sialidase [Candidatus Thiosymbion oneisti]|uniref:exo-alpha-sialidase n=1 Tax=Candidatus Thiosymbion oneisti TaxID=589554 RepID=UPI000AA81367